jgi:two-component system sensor histidine kinase KdpD
MRAYMQTRAIPGPWPAGERLLVCVGPGRLSERLVRTARRLAEQLSAEWYAVYVETADHSRLTDASQSRVTRVMQLAEELGAQAVTLPGESVTGAVLQYAHTHNVTKIIAGKPLRSRWQEWLRPSPVERLIRQSGTIDATSSAARRTTRRLPGACPGGARSTWAQYLQSAALVGAATLAGWPMHGLIAPTNLVMLYLVVVMVAAVYSAVDRRFWRRC